MIYNMSMYQEHIEHAKVVKEKLWKFGFSVKDYSSYAAIGFDLHVSEKYKVFVGTQGIEKMPRGCDIYAQVDGEDVKFYFKKQNKVVVEKSPLLVFNKNS